jgi:hypothetical protein
MPELRRPVETAVEFQQVPSTTVVDRRHEEEIHAFGSGSAVHGMDVFFSTATSEEDAQRRAILAAAGV